MLASDVLKTVIPSLGWDRRRGRAMMGGRNQGQGQLFYDLCLDEVVPDDHLVRKIGAVLNLSWIHTELAPFDRSGADDPDADPRVRFRHSIRASDLPGGSGQLD